MLSSVPLKPFSVATLLAVHETNTRKDYKRHLTVQHAAPMM